MSGRTRQTGRFATGMHVDLSIHYPAATASIATGVYPTEHEIAGAFWYNREDDRVAYYGDDFWVVIDEGMDRSLMTLWFVSITIGSMRTRCMSG
ncbi:MAG: hypothetical protein R3C02_23365 [Planctomycetaceae bacterium]